MKSIRMRVCFDSSVKRWQISQTYQSSGTHHFN